MYTYLLYRSVTTILGFQNSDVNDHTRYEELILRRIDFRRPYAKRRT